MTSTSPRSDRCLNEEEEDEEVDHRSDDGSGVKRRTQKSCADDEEMDVLDDDESDRPSHPPTRTGTRFTTVAGNRVRILTSAGKEETAADDTAYVRGLEQTGGAPPSQPPHHEMCISADDLRDLETFRIISEKDAWDGGGGGGGGVGVATPSELKPEIVDYGGGGGGARFHHQYGSGRRRFIAGGGSLGQSFTELSTESNTGGGATGLIVIKHENNNDEETIGAEANTDKHFVTTTTSTPSKFLSNNTSDQPLISNLSSANIRRSDGAPAGTPILLSTGQLFHTAFGDLHGFKLQPTNGSGAGVNSTLLAGQQPGTLLMQATANTIGGTQAILAAAAANPTITTTNQTQAQLSAEAQRKRELRLQKNREAARECRRKKKEYIKCLESRVAVLENQNKALIEELRQLKEPGATGVQHHQQQQQSGTLKLEATTLDNE